MELCEVAMVAHFLPIVNTVITANIAVTISFTIVPL